MPFKSKRQRKYMFANEPEVARRWADEAKGTKASPKKASPKKRVKRRSSK
jgi:hypothetical protein